MRRKLVLLAAVVAAGLALAPGVAAGGGGCHRPPREEASAEVALEENCFGPTVSHVEPGTTVRWKSAMGEAPHTVSGYGWGSDTLEPGDVFGRRFEEAGVYPYYCALHPGMTGAVVVDEDIPASSQGASGPAWWIAVIGALVAAGAGFVAGRVNASRRGA